MRYFPIDAGVAFDCVGSDLLKIDWSVARLAADFIVDDARAIRVRFDGSTIIRLLDEMPLSTEGAGSAGVKGLVSNHFAYRVEGAVFAATQSEVYKDVFGPVEHYQFVTGCGCMDVLTGVAPTFEVVDREG